jgi:hypothetical protein
MIIDRNELIGAWRLHDYVLVDADGGESRPLREGSTGLLLYTANGYMSAATKLIDDRTGEAKFMSYHGPFDLYEDHVVHHIEMSSDDGLVGRDNVRYPALDGDTLTITARPGLLGGEGSEAHIVWRRAKRP